ncbi:hypothetical protein BDQ12DRAFT_631389 [Crucibulum laeve]|uniref:Uncharacterized protein n=1 Tax=Crucibulum laeve TaxID=68775 RepID=A0A5C3LZM3_9AGAR|nr:hypothetical protein BDQ12DRAFT_631389 [Crucibulum laeve]
MPTAFPDLTDALPAGSTTPTAGRTSPNRRETILSLVEMLLQQSETSGRGTNPQSNFEDDRDVPTVDEHLQVVGAEAFNRFQRRINNLDKELRNFANAARQLGSSVAILSSAFHLRERLAQILFLYRENAADLFPRKITHIAREAPAENHMPGRRRRGQRMRYKAPPHVATPTVSENLDPENFPEQLEHLARDVTTFLNCLNEFPEFTDEAVNASILAFQGDLQYWASCLKEYSGQFKYPAVQRYIHDLSIEMGEHIDSITSTLSMFIEVGVPTIRFAQKHGATNLLNLSTVATFFSAVTATTLQFSFGLQRSSLSDSVNCFWFASLVFSIGAAVNSLLGLTWKQAMYRSPGHRVPWWVLIWIKRSPLVFLVMSVACFSVGLCFFAYASNQAPITSTVTTVFTAFTSFGLAAVSAWFASERWIFLRHRGKKWLSDALIESKEQFLHWPGIETIRKGYRVLKRNIKKARKSIWRACGRAALFFSNQDSDSECSSDDLEAGVLPTTNGNHNPNPHIYEPTSPVNQHSSAPWMESPRITPTPLNTPHLEKENPFDVAAHANGKNLWKNALRAVKVSQLSPPSTPIRPSGPDRQFTGSSGFSNIAGSIIQRRRATAVEPVMRSRVTNLVPKLVAMEPIQDLAAHQALVRHLQFSPDGKFLATSSWDRTSVIFRVGVCCLLFHPTFTPSDVHSQDPFVSHRILAHAQGFVGQVAWSPAGKWLLTKLPRGMKIWTAEEGVCKKTIDRHIGVDSITWCPGGETFLSVEGSYVTKLDLNGTVLDQYHFGAMKLHDVAMTPDSQRLLGVGPLLNSPTGLHPSKSRAEKRLVVYNTDTKQIENQTPVLNDVRDITLAQTARSGLIALVSYENKAPPQLWKLDTVVKDREAHTSTVRLTLRHTYMPKTPVDFAGPSYFGGKNHELVLCAGKAGDIHIWDRESGSLLHHVRAQAHGGDLTCIAWNHAAEEPFMFATGSHDGGVRIWSKPPPDEGPEDIDETPIAPNVSRSQPTFHFEMSRSSSPASQESTQTRDSSSISLEDRIHTLASLTRLHVETNG